MNTSFYCLNINDCTIICSISAWTLTVRVNSQSRKTQNENKNWNLNIQQLPWAVWHIPIHNVLMMPTYTTWYSIYVGLTTLASLKHQFPWFTVILLITIINRFVHKSVQSHRIKTLNTNTSNQMMDFRPQNSHPNQSNRCPKTDTSQNCNSTLYNKFHHHWQKHDFPFQNLLQQSQQNTKTTSFHNHHKSIDAITHYNKCCDISYSL